MGENLYLFMIIALAVLAITDLVVGVSNDAVNFLNSAIGSKAISFRTIMIVFSMRLPGLLIQRGNRIWRHVFKRDDGSSAKGDF